MAKKNKNNFSEHLVEKQKIESRLEEIRFELDSPEISSGTISKMSLDLGEAKARFESFKLNHSKDETVLDNYCGECDRLEYVYKGASERLLASKDKRDRLKAEHEELKQRLLEMRYQLAKGELASILQIYKEAETQKAALIKSISEHETKKGVIQQTVDNGESIINSLMAKRQEHLAGQAMGTNNASTSVDSLDSEINDLIASQSTEQQLLDNAEDMIAGLNALLKGTEQKAETLRTEAQEAVCYHLIERAKIAGEKYSSAAAELGKYFAELQALGDVLESISKGSFPLKITLYDAYRLFVPAFSDGSVSKVQLSNGLLTLDQINIPSMVQAERENLKEMGFTW